MEPMAGRPGPAHRNSVQQLFSLAHAPRAGERSHSPSARHGECRPARGGTRDGERPFEVTGGHVNDVQLRTASELWHKEQLINIGVSRFPVDWKYGAYVDGDFHFTRHDLAIEAIHQLQHYDFVQLFSSYADLSGDTYGTGQRPLRINNGFAYNYIQNGYRLPAGYQSGGWKQAAADDVSYGSPYQTTMTAGPQLGVGATGGAWAWRRPAFDTVGGNAGYLRARPRRLVHDIRSGG